MTKERFDGIKARSKESLVEMFPFLLDMRDLVAEVERLTRERDAAIADLDAYKVDKCSACRFNVDNPDALGCTFCSGWQWRGVKEAGE